MSWLKNGNWGLKILALVLAIVVYLALKDDPKDQTKHHDREATHLK